MGVNLGQQDFFGAADFMQNLFDNPGFEPPTDGHLIVVGSGATSSSFVGYQGQRRSVGLLGRSTGFGQNGCCSRHNLYDYRFHQRRVLHVWFMFAQLSDSGCGSCSGGDFNLTGGRG